jgi:hypothetical protein
LQSLFNKTPSPEKSFSSNESPSDTKDFEGRLLALPQGEQHELHQSLVDRGFVERKHMKDFALEVPARSSLS